jgi:hypothetical protein
MQGVNCQATCSKGWAGSAHLVSTGLERPAGAFFELDADDVSSMLFRILVVTDLLLGQVNRQRGRVARSDEWDAHELPHHWRLLLVAQVPDRLKLRELGQLQPGSPELLAILVRKGPNEGRRSEVVCERGKLAGLFGQRSACREGGRQKARGETHGALAADGTLRAEHARPGTSRRP